MIDEIFADGVSNIHITGNLARIDLVTHQPQQSEGSVYRPQADQGRTRQPRRI